MNPRRLAIIRIGIILIISLGFATTIILLLNIHKKVFSLVQHIVDSERMSRIFFIDSLLPNNNFAKKSFIFSSLFAVVIHLKQIIFGDDVKEDIFEHVSEGFFLTSSLLFLIIPFYLKNLTNLKKQKILIRSLLIMAGLALMFIFLEEISYGQHLFGWESSGVFETYNFQNETNLHNFINPFYRFIYPTLGFGLFAVCSILWFFYKDHKPIWLEFLTPHKSLIILAFFMAASTYKGHSESFEHLLALFALLYGWRLILILRNPKSSINIEKK